MNWKRNVLRKSDIYAVIDTQQIARKNISKFVKALLKIKVRIFQLRCKNLKFEEILKLALRLNKLTDNKALLIINDYPEIALLSDADGLHIGQKDISLNFARQLLGSDKIIGVSCNNLSQAINAQKNRADYIGFGSLFNTKTKQSIKIINTNSLKALNRIQLPVFLIGGISAKKLKQSKIPKIKKIAVCTALTKSKYISKTVSDLRGLLNK